MDKVNTNTDSKHVIHHVQPNLANNSNPASPILIPTTQPITSQNNFMHTLLQYKNYILGTIVLIVVSYFIWSKFFQKKSIEEIPKKKNKAERIKYSYDDSEEEEIEEEPIKQRRPKQVEELGTISESEELIDENLDEDEDENNSEA